MCLDVSRPPDCLSDKGIGGYGQMQTFGTERNLRHHEACYPQPDLLAP